MKLFGNKYKREKFVIQPGKICTLDAKNLLKRDTTGTILVEVLGAAKHKEIGMPWWNIVGCGPDRDIMPEPIEVPEFLLSPDGMVVIRNPTDFPIINDKDIALLKELIHYFENPPKDKGITILSIKDESLQRLKALLVKMVTAKSMREI